MSSPLTNAVLKSGLVSKNQLAEFRRWKVPIEVPENVPEAPKSIEEAGRAIEQALESEGLVISRDTDLNILQQYLHTQMAGVLHVEIPTDDLTVEDAEDIDVMFGLTTLGEYIIPWRSESIEEALTNGFTYLTYGNGTFTVRAVFTDSRELFYGQHKAFVVCRAAPITSVQDAGLALTSGEDHGSNDPS
jgi:hypothetical protein